MVPEICGMANKQGYAPLGSWMLALSVEKERDLANEAISFLAERTDMKIWQDQEATNKENLARLTQRRDRQACSSFRTSPFKADLMNKAIGEYKRGKYPNPSSHSY